MSPRAETRVLRTTVVYSNLLGIPQTVPLVRVSHLNSQGETTLGRDSLLRLKPINLGVREW